METNKNIEVQATKDDKGYTYVFDTKDEMKADDSWPRIRRKLWQIVPSICGSLICIPFGLMIGWTSPSYPTLLKADSPVPFTIDQSAMIAGFLMVGNALGTPLSSNRKFASKYGIIIGAALMVAGWLVMWRARDIYYLLLSRLLVGCGHGYANGQLKVYIGEMCEPALAGLLTRLINLYMFFAVILAFAIGPQVEFRQFSIICTFISIGVLFVTMCLPSTPRALVQDGKLEKATSIIEFLSPGVSVEQLDKIKQQIAAPSDDLTFVGILKDNELRKKFAVFALLVFFQQFTGAPATIVYCEILFRRSHSPFPEFCALLYAIVFFFANVYGVLYSPDFNKRKILLFSSGGVACLLLIKIMIIVLQANYCFWNFSALITMLIYITIHTVGLGNVPFTFIAGTFPKQAKKVLVHYFVITHSLLALIITKIFQVMSSRLEFYTPFCLFFCVSVAAFVFIKIFIPAEKKTSPK